MANTKFDEASSGGTVKLQNVTGFPLLKRETAAEIGLLFLRDRWGKERLQSQLPLTVEDKETYWRVFGSSSVESDEGQFCILLKKNNAQILEIGMFHGPPGDAP